MFAFLKAQSPSISSSRSRYRAGLCVEEEGKPAVKLSLRVQCYGGKQHVLQILIQHCLGETGDAEATRFTVRGKQGQVAAER